MSAPIYEIISPNVIFLRHHAEDAIWKFSDPIKNIQRKPGHDFDPKHYWFVLGVIQAEFPVIAGIVVAESNLVLRSAENDPRYAIIRIGDFYNGIVHSSSLRYTQPRVLAAPYRMLDLLLPPLPPEAFPLLLAPLLSLVLEDVLPCEVLAVPDWAAVAPLFP